MALTEKFAVLPAQVVCETGWVTIAVNGLTVAVVSQVLLHVPLIVVSVSVKEPAPPAVTSTTRPVVAPGIVPLPLIDQLYPKPVT